MSCYTVFTVVLDPHHSEDLNATFRNQSAVYPSTQAVAGCLTFVARMSPASLLLCGAATATGCTAAAGVSQLKRTGEIYGIGLFSQSQLS